ncbi:Gfo/Idh/MocA family protein [Trinickia diaoshuihuensis]|jgi:predicted dehydrogenase|uniref:Gfo/Idh/MocA family protein n=1 Tax=Trinickia diaoshuihuensis TaxID=2292265 RepID=UPI000E234430|nr:Gfo/Idh/MocA family oxidoreductase [Trinickia diaoshuihuensis]
MNSAPGTIRLAAIGAGFMSRRRIAAFVSTGRVELVGIAARRLSSAQALGAQFGCSVCYDDPLRLVECAPDAVLIEVPHSAQDALASWAIGQRLPTLIGGPLSASLAGGARIVELARAHDVLIELGFEARYKAVWETARDWIEADRIGRPIAIQSIALWNGNAGSWYYDEAASGGMPLTHMSYAFINPLRWLFGEPLRVSAFANRIRHTADHQVREETCVANLLFPRDVLCSMLAGYVKPGNAESWQISIVGSEGVLELRPTEMENGSLRLYRGEEITTMDFAGAQDAFIAQAHAFLDSIEGRMRCRNRPHDALNDLRIAAAITASAREHRSIELDQPVGHAPGPPAPHCRAPNENGPGA